MRRFIPAGILAVAPLLVLLGDGGAPYPSAPTVEWNDNRKPAGTLTNDTLDLAMEVAWGRWYVLGPDKPSVPMLAFAERGRALTNPGPLIRVPQGTIVHVSVTNAVDSQVVVHGLTARKAESVDSLIVPPHATREVTFPADAPGTYFYWAATRGESLDERDQEDSQLSGGLVVDPPGTVQTPEDRIFLIGLWLRDEDEFLTINGRPWPLTERLSYTMGDSVRWRLINASEAPHPMHLHGFFFRVDARGDIAHDTIYWPAQRRMAVTELMEPGTTAGLVWSPDRPGAWIFHCHLSFHVVMNPGVGPDRKTEDQRIQEIFFGRPAHRPEVQHGMGGLILGIDVKPSAGWHPDTRARRVLRLFVDSDSTPTDTVPRFGYVLQQGDRVPDADSIQWPGSRIVLQKGEPTTIWVINRSIQPTQVHWHGLEIESPFDGVTGLSGYGANRAPVIMPGDSFEVRVTPPRSGSYMYHTHVNDIEQQMNGLYGALLVVDDRATWDSTTDVTFLVSNDMYDFQRVLLNGRPERTDTLHWRQDRTYRLRLMNITTGNPNLRVRLVRVLGANAALVGWTEVAKDGYDLSPQQRVRALGERQVSIGETVDVEFRPAALGSYRLEVQNVVHRTFVSQAITVTK